MSRGKRTTSAMVTLTWRVSWEKSEHHLITPRCSMDLPSITGDLMGYLPSISCFGCSMVLVYLPTWLDDFRAHVMVNIPYMEHHLRNDACFSAMFDYYYGYFSLVNWSEFWSDIIRRCCQSKLLKCRCPYWLFSGEWRERFGAMRIHIFPIRWGAIRSYQEFPNHILVETSNFIIMYIIYIHTIHGAPWA